MVIGFDLNSIFSDINIATPALWFAFAWGIFFPSLHPQPVSDLVA